MRGLERIALPVLVVCVLIVAPVGAEIQAVRTFQAVGSVDQDDLCFWIHPTDPSRSVVIASDKFGGAIYVYDLDGRDLQTILVGKPGNIDVRYGIHLGGECVDLVAVNDRDTEKILVFRVDPADGTLERVDNGTIVTGENYGLTLHRGSDGSLFAITGAKEAPSLLRQYRLFDDGSGQVGGTPTGWEFLETTVEGMVGDDENGYVFLGEEDVGIWRVSMTDDTDRTLIAQVGDSSGLTADVEGLTIYRLEDGEGYLIASSQGADKYTVLDRRPPHAPIGEFGISGAGETDGIDVINVALNETFPAGIFGFHNGADCCPVQAVPWEQIAAQVPALAIAPSAWSRDTCEPTLQVSRSSLDWNEAAPATSYDVLLGDLSTLLASGSGLTASVQQCLADDAPATTLSWSDVPGPGEGVWMLVRGGDAASVLSWDATGPPQSGSRDEPLAAAAVQCP